MPSRIRQAFRWIVFLCGVLALCGSPAEPPDAETVSEINGLPASTKIVRARKLSDADLPSLARLPQLEDVDFASGWGVEDAEITDQGLAKLAALGLPRLDYLNLGYCKKISDAGLAHVANMKTVTHLMLFGCPQITDDGPMPLLKMQQLIYLDLRGCPGVTDRGLDRLAEKNNWEQVLLGGCPHITAGGVARLQSKLPKTRVEKDDQEWSWNQKS
jgi:hypothetical protein